MLDQYLEASWLSGVTHLAILHSKPAVLSALLFLAVWVQVTVTVL